jgi:hypothetical protein
VNGDRLVLTADVGFDEATHDLLRRSPLEMATNTATGRAALQKTCGEKSSP